MEEASAFTRNDFAEVLNIVRPVEGISDAQLQQLLERYAKRLDMTYYTHSDESRADIVVEDVRYCIDFREWAHGYYMTVIDKEENTVRTVFVDLVRGDWTIMPEYFKKPEFIGDLLALNAASREFIALQHTRNTAARS